MKKVLLATLMVGLMLVTVLSTVVTANPTFINKEITEDEETLDDCGCQTVSKQELYRLNELSNRIDKLLNRAEIYTKFISIFFKDNSEIKENSEKLINSITKLKVLNIVLKSELSFQYRPIICAYLLALAFQMGLGWNIFISLHFTFYEINFELAQIFYNIAYSFLGKLTIILEQMTEYDCWL